MSITPTRLALGVALLIAVLLGMLLAVREMQGGTWQIALVTPVPADAATVDTGAPETDLNPPTEPEPPAARSGMARMYAGYANVPHGGFVFSFLQSGGTGFDVHWSSVRGYEATFTTASVLPSWTSPTTCTAPATQCGHLAIAVPVAAPPGRPETWVLSGGAGEVIDDTTWHGQHGELTLHGRQYYVILTDAGNISAGATVSLEWPLPWDGTGAPPLPPTP